MNKDIPEFFKERDVFGLEKPVIKIQNFKNVPEPPPELNFEYAGLGVRILAYILDGLIIFFPLIIIEGILFQEEPVSDLNRNFISLFTWTLYYAATESSDMQATFGKRILGLKVIDEYGNKISFTRAALRHLAIILSVLPLGFGIWAIASDKKKQGWHDSLLECLIVKRKNVDGTI
jgi:uncharacterized RDD family membrane protein YckC